MIPVSSFLSVTVIGASGFLGSAIVSGLLQDGIGVYAVSRGGRFRSKHPRLTPVPVGDFESCDWSRILRDIPPGPIVFAGGSSSVAASVMEPDQDFLANVQVVSNLAEALIDSESTRHLVMLSSAAVYGSTGGTVVSDDHPCHPISPYGKNKLMAEQICRSKVRESAMAVTVLRPFSVYGPGLNKRLFWEVATQCLTQDRVVVRGSGHEVRDFLYIDDFVDAVRLVLRNSPPAGEVTVANVASGVSYRIASVVGLLCEILRPEGVVIDFRNECIPWDPPEWRAKCGRLESYGWSPKTDIKRGLGRYALSVAKQYE